MDKFQNKYRIQSARLQGYDYGSSGAYFITICTKNRIHFFGKIVETDSNPPQNGIDRNSHQKMELNDIGILVENEWLKTIELRPDMNLQLDAYVVMPNHFHGIIIIGDNQYNTGRDGLQSVSMGNINNNTKDGLQSGSTQNVFGTQSKNIASIIRGFKSAVTKNARLLNPTFEWQTRFHDHIIRDEKSFNNIHYYICNNPKKWKEDTFYKS